VLGLGGYLVARSNRAGTVAGPARPMEFARLANGAHQADVADDQNKKRNELTDGRPDHFVDQQQLWPVVVHATDRLYMTHHNACTTSAVYFKCICLTTV